MNMDRLKVAFYVIRDELTGKYYESRRCESTLCSTRAHFERVEGALKMIKDCQGDGINVVHWVIVPVYLDPGTPIKPDIIKQKEGYVIKISKPNYRGVVEESYWKGNKKKPFDPKFLVSAVCDLRGRPQTLTASIFDTGDDAVAKVNQMVAAIYRLSRAFRDEGGSSDDTDYHYVRELESIDFAINKV